MTKILGSKITLHILTFLPIFYPRYVEKSIYLDQSVHSRWYSYVTITNKFIRLVIIAMAQPQKLVQPYHNHTSAAVVAVLWTLSISLKTGNQHIKKIKLIPYF